MSRYVESEFFECENNECMAFFEGHCLWRKSDKDKIDLSDPKTCPKIIEQLKEQKGETE